MQRVLAKKGNQLTSQSSLLEIYLVLETSSKMLSRRAFQMSPLLSFISTTTSTAFRGLLINTCSNALSMVTVLKFFFLIIVS